MQQNSTNGLTPKLRYFSTLKNNITALANLILLRGGLLLCLKVYTKKRIIKNNSKFFLKRKNFAEK
jgi:hypothetical protein